MSFPNHKTAYLPNKHNPLTDKRNFLNFLFILRIVSSTIQQYVEAVEVDGSVGWDACQSARYIYTFLKYL